jgi:hypothetical protein
MNAVPRRAAELHRWLTMRNDFNLFKASVHLQKTEREQYVGLEVGDRSLFRGIFVVRSILV